MGCEDNQTMPNLQMSYPIKWVTIPKLAELSGYSVGAIAKKIDRGDWIEGILWTKSPDGRRQVNVEAFNKWVEGTLRAS